MNLARALWIFFQRVCLRCGHPFSWWEARALATEHWECPVVLRED